MDSFKLRIWFFIGITLFMISANLTYLYKKYIKHKEKSDVKLVLIGYANKTFTAFEGAIFLDEDKKSVVDTGKLRLKIEEVSDTSSKVLFDDEVEITKKDWRWAEFGSGIFKKKKNLVYLGKIPLPFLEDGKIWRITVIFKTSKYGVLSAILNIGR